jgi:hypothetical protein
LRRDRLFLVTSSWFSHIELDGETERRREEEMWK